MTTLDNSPKISPRFRKWKWFFLVSAVAPLIYGLLAYILFPLFWRVDEHRYGNLNSIKITHTAEGIPSDPINIGLVGNKESLQSALSAAGWLPADPIRLTSLWNLLASLSLHRPYPTAPVSSLYLFHRKEDLAYEKDVGKTFRRRHHFRLWRVDPLSDADQVIWIGSASFDRGIGFSRRDGQILHHIAPNIDAERDYFIATLMKADKLLRVDKVTGIGLTLNGRNGEGDWYYTDGIIKIGILK